MRSRGLAVDSFSILYRGHYAAPAAARSDGVPTGALLSFLRTTLALLQQFNPTAVVCAFDRPGRTFRSELADDYKAGRSPMPDDLKTQLPLVREGLAALGVRVFDAEGFEADDVLASWVRAFPDDGECTVVSTDKDMLQLVDDARSVRVYNPATKRLIAEREVVERFGVLPSQMVDLQVLMGDKADNIAGVPGVGIKTASRLVSAWGSWESVVANAHTIPSAMQRGAIEDHAAQLPRFAELVTLRDDVALPSPLLAEFAPRGVMQRVAETTAEAPVSGLSRGSAGRAKEGEVAEEEHAAYPFTDAALARNERFMAFLYTYELYTLAAKLKQAASGTGGALHPAELDSSTIMR
jgi:DNA polymerase-1